MKPKSKYTEHNLIPIFIKAAQFRKEMLDLEFTDNGGAIHSAERIINILGVQLKYPGLGHINNYKHYSDAEFSEPALQAYNRGEKVYIEHVSPLRDFTRKAIELIEKNLNDGSTLHAKIKEFVIKNYRLVLLTHDETKALNKINRSKMVDDRLGQAGITVVTRHNT
jgi:hypothetical protein